MDEKRAEKFVFSDHAEKIVFIQRNDVLLDFLGLEKSKHCSDGEEVKVFFNIFKLGFDFLNENVIEEHALQLKADRVILVHGTSNLF